MQPRARPVALTGSDQAVSATRTVYRGVALRNSHATDAVTVVLYDNASAASGTVLDSWTLAAGATASVCHDGIQADSGIYADVSGTGTLVGSVRIG